MAVDLAIDNNGDLIFSGNRDLMTVSGIEQIEQRIRMRLLLPRGSLIHDLEQMVGSDLHSTLRLLRNDNALEQVRLQVFESLSFMDGIQVSDVQLEFSDTGALLIHVAYRMETGIEETEGEALADPTLNPGDVDLTLIVSTEEANAA